MGDRTWFYMEGDIFVLGEVFAWGGRGKEGSMCKIYFSESHFRAA